ncbi:MAG: hypothetical protein AUJ75_00975 [Candidatus Omnitrophica bacterium CG1_02_49_10]|nr:MAG: hypothetical protein AUJ75_00975 [Candidatus Omnitrophica bacterium CG1_02_49_10]
MPVHRSPIKSIRSDKKKHLRKINALSRLKTLERKFLKLVGDNKPETGKLLEGLKAAFQKAASKKLIHKKTASRKISRLTRLLNKKSA